MRNFSAHVKHFTFIIPRSSFLYNTVSLIYENAAFVCRSTHNPGLKINFEGKITVNSYLVVRCRLLSGSGGFWFRSEGFSISYLLPLGNARVHF